jgi:hypothetical protein
MKLSTSRYRPVNREAQGLAVRRGAVEQDTCQRGCPWTSADECATARERSVAGTSDPIPSCPIHGEQARQLVARLEAAGVEP